MSKKTFGNYVRRAYCPDCGSYVDTPTFGKAFFVDPRTCPKCGHFDLSETAVFLTERREYNLVWWNPLTWFRYEWKVKQ